MNIFDRICAVLALALGVVLLVSGFVGIFVSMGLWYRLPPVLGIIPAFAGWGIVRSVYFGWQNRISNGPSVPPQPVSNSTAHQSGNDSNSSASQT